MGDVGPGNAKVANRKGWPCGRPKCVRFQGKRICVECSVVGCAEEQSIPGIVGAVVLDGDDVNGVQRLQKSDAADGASKHADPTPGNPPVARRTTACA